jgi:predicted nucleic acid-binding protein
MPDIFVDTNVLLRHLLQDDPDQSPRASSFLAGIERGDVTAYIADTVVFEAVFTLQRRHGVSKQAIREALLAFVRLPSVILPDKRRLLRVFDLYVDAGLSFADAYHVAIMEQRGLDKIASFDRDFTRIPGITRVEPE